MQIEKTLRHFHTSLDSKQLSSLKGEIYECYCYEQIVNKYSNINFIKLEEIKMEIKMVFISLLQVHYVIVHILLI